MGKLRKGKEKIQKTMAKYNRKKSMRLIMQNYKIGLRRKANNNFVWPRTVEAARDPFLNPTGKNKMFYVIACDLYPTSKIVQPSDSESEDEQENSPDNESEEHKHADSHGMRDPLATQDGKSTVARRNGFRTTHGGKQRTGRINDSELSWRCSQYNRRNQHRKPRHGKIRLMDRALMLEVINYVVQTYAPKKPKPNLPSPVEESHDHDLILHRLENPNKDNVNSTNENVDEEEESEELTEELISGEESIEEEYDDANEITDELFFQQQVQ